MPARNASSESETAEGVPPSSDDENDSDYDEKEDAPAIVVAPPTETVTNNNEKLDVDKTKKKASEDMPNPAANSSSKDKPVTNLVVSKPAPPSPQIDRPSANQKMCYYEVVSVSNKEKQSSVNTQKQMNVSPSPQQLGEREAMIKRLKETVAERFTKMSQQKTVETEKKPTENPATISSTPQQMATPAAASSTVENNKSTPAAAEVPSEKEKKPKLVGGFGMGRRK
jgi:hypothetical protein